MASGSTDQIIYRCKYYDIFSSFMREAGRSNNTYPNTAEMCASSSANIRNAKMVRSTLPWNTKSTRSLINNVKRYPRIWDNKNPDYGNKSMKTKAFTSIANLLKKKFPELNELNAELAQKKFTTLRTTYQQEAKKTQESGSAGQVKSNWEYFNDCSFIPKTKTTKVSTASTGNAVPSTSAVVTATAGPSSHTPEAIEGTSHSTPTPSQLPSASMSGEKDDGKRERETPSEAKQENGKMVGELVHKVFDNYWGQMCCADMKNRFMTDTLDLITMFKNRNECKGCCPDSSVA